MNALMIGILTGLLVIVIIGLVKGLDKQLVYGLVLSAIGFLYVGFTWTNTTALVINIQQAICFLFLAYYGVKKKLNILAAGFFLHGCWDLVYPLFPVSNLLPPHYDIFCLSVDFTIGIYLIIVQYRERIIAGGKMITKI